MTGFLMATWLSVPLSIGEEWPSPALIPQLTPVPGPALSRQVEGGASQRRRSGRCPWKVGLRVIQNPAVRQE